MSKEDVFFIMQRKAFDLLNAEMAIGSQKFKVNPNSITIPANLIQEQPLTSTKNVLDFTFGTKAPIGTEVLNNVVLGDNDVAAIYGVQILIGQGPLVNSRIYRAFGPSAQDNAPYNAQLQFQLETNVSVTQVDTLQFRKEDGTTKDQFDGAAPINPIRIITGRISTFKVSIVMKDVSALVFTPNLFVSMRLLVGLGQASAV